VQRRGRGQHAGGEDGDGDGQEAERHEEVADVQDRHQRLGAGAPAGPAAEADRVRRGRHQAGGGGRPRRGRGDPGGEREDGKRYRGGVEAVRRSRQPPRRPAGEPVPGEARDDAAAEQHDQEDDGGDAEPASPALRRGA
jgi:hypothetical protein